MKRIRKILHWITVIMVGGTCLLLALPYLIPLKPTLDYSEPSLLFPNSIIEPIEGVNVHYRVFNASPPKKGNVLMIHGFSGSTFSWRKNIDTLTKAGYQVVCMDLPSFGFSERKTDWNHSPENRAKLAWSIANKISPNETWHLVGHSMGASVILTMGQIQSQKTQSMICVDGLFFNPSSSSWIKFFLNSRYVYRLAEVALQRYFLQPERFKKILASAYGQTPDEEAFNGYLKPLTVTDAAKGILSTTNQTSNFQINYNTLITKMFLIWGEKDTWISLSSAQKFKEKYPHVPLMIIKNAGHCPMETHYQVFNTHLLECIEDKNNHSE